MLIFNYLITYMFTYIFSKWPQSQKDVKVALGFQLKATDFLKTTGLRSQRYGFSPENATSLHPSPSLAATLNNSPTSTQKTVARHAIRRALISALLCLHGLQRKQVPTLCGVLAGKAADPKADTGQPMSCTMGLTRTCRASQDPSAHICCLSFVRCLCPRMLLNISK